MYAITEYIYDNGSELNNIIGYLSNKISNMDFFDVMKSLIMEIINDRKYYITTIIDDNIPMDNEYVVCCQNNIILYEIHTKIVRGYIYNTSQSQLLKKYMWNIIPVTIHNSLESVSTMPKKSNELLININDDCSNNNLIICIIGKKYDEKKSIVNEIINELDIQLLMCKKKWNKIIINDDNLNKSYDVRDSIIIMTMLMLKSNIKMDYVFLSRDCSLITRKKIYVNTLNSLMTFEIFNKMFDHMQYGDYLVVDKKRTSVYVYTA